MSENEQVEIVVSDEFFDIYKNFNVTNQIENIKKLKLDNIEEFYLLLVTCIDKHLTLDNNTDATVNLNLSEFEAEVMEIFDLQDDKVVENETLNNLVKKTNNSYINTNIIRDKNGSELPEPYNLSDIRNIKIDNIIDKD